MIENSCTALAESKMDSWNLSNVLTSIQGSSISGDDIHNKHFYTCYNMEMVVVGKGPPSSSTDVWLCILCRVADFPCSTCFHTTFCYTSNGYSGWFGPSSPVVFLLSCCPVYRVVTLYDQLPPAHKHYCTYTTDRGNYHHPPQLAGLCNMLFVCWAHYHPPHKCQPQGCGS